MPSPTTPLSMIVRMRDAINAHDLDTLAACFAPDYASEFPAHPDRAFRGTDSMRKNWTQIFAGVPDLAATLVHSASDDGTAWGEWDWRGTRADGAAFAMRGVTILGVEHDLITWARMYMEPVETGGSGNDAAVRQRVAGGGSA